jgi:TonB family protein
MFETSVVQARAKTSARRPLLLTVALGAHAAVIVGVLTASVATVQLPRRAPNQMTLLRVVIPPVLGDGSERKTNPATQPPQVKRAATPATVVAPTTLPEHATPVASQTTTADLGPAGNTATGPATGSDSGPGVRWGSPEGVGVDGPPATGPAPKIYTAGGDVKAPVVLRRVTPPYPLVAQRMRLNGFVILECIIDQTGHIRDAKVVKSSFSAFEQPALDAVQQWQFAPGTLNGVPVDVQFDLKVTFEIR